MPTQSIIGTSNPLSTTSGMPQLIIVLWRDIPAQVIAKEGRKTVKAVLSERFAEAIDKAAMRAQMAGTDAYLEQWQRKVSRCEEDLQLAVDTACAELEQTYSDTHLARLVDNGGLAPHHP